MVVNRESGNAILLMFIAVALFGALSYVFLQGSRNSMTVVTSEATKAAGYKSQDCSNAVSMATKRLQARGCGTMISTLADGSNTNPGAPTDGSCSIYHPNGGGVKSCGLATLPPPPPDACITGPVGDVCASDGAIYVGMIAGSRIYIAPTDGPTTLMWKTINNSLTPGSDSDTDGLANMNAMISYGISAHPAGQVCANMNPPGTWYLPSKNDWLTLRFLVQSTALPGFNYSGTYWSSTQLNSAAARAMRVSDGQILNASLNMIYNVRCIRK